MTWNWISRSVARDKKWQGRENYFVKGEWENYFRSHDVTIFSPELLVIVKLFHWEMRRASLIICERNTTFCSDSQYSSIWSTNIWNPPTRIVWHRKWTTHNKTFKGSRSIELNPFLRVPQLWILHLCWIVEHQELRIVGHQGQPFP